MMDINDQVNAVFDAKDRSARIDSAMEWDSLSDMQKTMIHQMGLLFLSFEDYLPYDESTAAVSAFLTALTEEGKISDELEGL